MKQLNIGEITLVIGAATFVVNTVSMVIVWKDRKRKPKGRHRKG
ncbi:hypothetical protein [Streptomyces swartbergensis]|nr:hypothetical protein [Streptomyces swartbergensis]